jgi:putative phosphoribosyl transferase
MFQDRRDAGRQLAAHVAAALGPVGGRAHPGDPPPIVLGLARGGVPVAAEVAAVLGGPLDVLIARKLGVPWQPELGMGAIAEGGGRVLNEELIREAGVDAASIETVERRERIELERRVDRYRRGRAPLELAGRTVVVVDDGLATGYTAWAAIHAVRERGAARVVLAVPVAPAETVSFLSGVADLVVVVTRPASFMAIGEFYRDFSQTDDDEVISILEAHRTER